MLSHPRMARNTSSNSKRSSESGMARMRMTMGLTLRRTARRINRLKGACMLIPSGYLPPCHQAPDLLLLSINVDQNRAYPAAVEALKAEGIFPRRVKLRQCKYLNHVVEQDHRTVKKRTW